MYAIPGAWADHAACLGATDRMVMPTTRLSGDRAPSIRARRHVDAARTICHGCPVRDDCLAWALTDPDPAHDMIAGGFTPGERHACRPRGPRVPLELPEGHVPRRCETCGYSLDGSHWKRRYCCNDCSPMTTARGRRKWDELAGASRATRLVEAEAI